MALTYPLLALWMLPCAMAVGTSTKLEWEPQEMYDVIKETRACGLESEGPGYICDPNGIVGDEIETFQSLLDAAARNGTKCPCSTYECEHAKSYPGYRIGVALVRKMKLQRREDGQLYSPEAQAQIFAYHLENTKWRMGRCEEDIVIFYSVEDRTLAIFAGQTAQEKFKPKYRQLLAFKVNEDFKNGRVISALHNLIHDLKIVLNCDFKDHDCGLQHSRSGYVSGNAASQSGWSFGVLALGSIMAAVQSLRM